MLGIDAIFRRRARKQEYTALSVYLDATRHGECLLSFESRLTKLDFGHFEEGMGCCERPVV